MRATAACHSSLYLLHNKAVQRAASVTVAVAKMRALRNLLLVVALLHLQLRLASCAEGTATIKGKVAVPVSHSPANAVVHLFTPTGQHMRAFCDSDGSFALQGVPKGAHMLQADLMGLYYPEIRVDTNSKGKVIRALYVPPNAKQAVALQEPLILRPAGEMHYYEKRKPVDVWGFVKTPYGLMMIFGLFVVFVVPKLKMDPEELQQLQGRPSSAQAKGKPMEKMERIAE